MKLEEIYSKESYGQVGMNQVTLQRVPFETDVDVLPRLSPLEPAARRGEATSLTPELTSLTSELTSTSTEEMVYGVESHRGHDADEELVTIPLKRVDSGPHEHCLLERPSTSGDALRSSTHQALLNEIDGSPKTSKRVEVDVKSGVEESSTNGDLADKAKAPKKGNTLTRMLKNIRLDKDKEKDSKDDSSEMVPQSSISRMLIQRIQPVAKASRDGFSKAINRIGDALHKKGDEKERPPVRTVPSTSSSSKMIGRNRQFRKYPPSKEVPQRPSKESTPEPKIPSASTAEPPAV